MVEAPVSPAGAQNQPEVAAKSYAKAALAGAGASASREGKAQRPEKKSKLQSRKIWLTKKGKEPAGGTAPQRSRRDGGLLGLGE
eukprot:3098193-Prymnesium_polylepis.1